jgi:AbrB family looped-hinge helix DNA binding protein
MMTTRLSTKGQLILPKTLREAHGWRPGTEFAVEEVRDGLLLRPVASFKATRFEDVLGCLAAEYKGKPKTLRDMEKGIAKRLKARHASGRY